MKVLVTGGAGYVGHAVVGALAAAPTTSEIVVVDNMSRRQYALLWGRRARQPTRFIEGDILDGRMLLAALDGVDAVVHLAAAVHTPGRDSEAHAFDQVNNWGSAQVAAAIEQVPTITRAIYLSSIAIYGSADEPFTTASTPRPNSFYGVTKLRGEAHFERLTTDERIVHVVRSGNVFGLNAAARLDSVANRFLFDGKFHGRLRIEGSGAQTRSFIHIDRLATALVALLVSDHDSATLNFAEHTRSIIDVAEVIKQFEPAVELLFVDQDMRMQHLDVRPSDALSQLAGAPTPDFAELMRDEWSQLGL